MTSLIRRIFGKKEPKIKIVVRTLDKTETQYHDIPENLSKQELTLYMTDLATKKIREYPGQLRYIKVTDGKTYGVKIESK